MIDIIGAVVVINRVRAAAEQTFAGRHGCCCLLHPTLLRIGRIGRGGSDWRCRRLFPACTGNSRLVVVIVDVVNIIIVGVAIRLHPVPAAASRSRFLLRTHCIARRGFV